jgi:polyphenol oxidase
VRRTSLGPGVGVAITDRRGGVSAPPYDALNLAAHVGDRPSDVAANRERLAAGIGLGMGDLVWMDQPHGSDVAVVTERSAAPAAGVDGLVTTEQGIALAVLVADCVPVLLADAAAGVVGVAHAGRRGLAGGVVDAVVATMRDRGADPARMDAIVGPAVCREHYEVPAALRDEVAAAVPGSAATTADGRPALDLRAGVLRRLKELGLPRAAVFADCTYEDPLLFSYRRDEVTGRFAALAWLEPA